MSVRLIFNSVWKNPGNRDRRFRRLARAAAWQFEKRLTGRPRTIRLPNGALFNAYPDCVVSSTLVYADWPEFHELQFIRQQLQPNDIIVDVGANVGHISLLVSDLVDPRNIFAFEPTPISFRRLVENWETNKWPTNNLFQKALGRSCGAAYIPDTAAPETKNAIKFVNGNATTVAVSVVPLDDARTYWRRHRIGLLKIDVEGFEVDVFAGARNMLQQDRPRLIMFESLADRLNDEIRAILQDAGFAIFQLDEAGRPDFARSSAQNLFAVPQDESFPA
jgi:FkbM family methyltransferase